MTEVCKAGCTAPRTVAMAGIARMVLTILLAGSSAGLARGVMPASLVTPALVVLWIAPLLCLAADYPLLSAGSRLRHCTGRIFWGIAGIWSALTLAGTLVAAAGLFAAGHPIPAILLEVYALGRVIADAEARSYSTDFLTGADGNPFGPEERHVALVGMYRGTVLLMLALIASATVLASGMAPAWAEAVMLTFLWSIAAPLALVVAFRFWRGFASDSDISEPTAPEPDDPDEQTLWEFGQIVGRGGWWLFNGGNLLLIYELILAEQTAIAVVFGFIVVTGWALNVEWELRKPSNERRHISKVALVLRVVVRGVFRFSHWFIGTPVEALRRMARRE